MRVSQTPVELYAHASRQANRGSQALNEGENRRASTARAASVARVRPITTSGAGMSDRGPNTSSQNGGFQFDTAVPTPNGDGRKSAYGSPPRIRAPPKASSEARSIGFAKFSA